MLIDARSLTTCFRMDDTPDVFPDQKEGRGLYRYGSSGKSLFLTVNWPSSACLLSSPSGVFGRRGDEIAPGADRTEQHVPHVLVAEAPILLCKS